MSDEKGYSPMTDKSYLPMPEAMETKTLVRSMQDTLELLRETNNFMAAITGSPEKEDSFTPLGSPSLPNIRSVAEELYSTTLSVNAFVKRLDKILGGNL